MSPPTTEDRVRAVIVRTFSLPDDAVFSGSSLADVPDWNSIDKLNLLFELEREFGVRFPGYAVPELTSVDAIVRQIDKQVGG